MPNGWDPASYWLVLNATSLNDELRINDNAPVQFAFTQIDNYGNVTAYDSYYLPGFDLKLVAVNGTCDDNKLKVENGVATTYFTLTGINGGSLIGSFIAHSAGVDFKFIKSIPDMTINVNDTAFKSPAKIEIILDSGATGELIVKVGNITQTKHISDSTIFQISDLPVGNYTVEVNYTGNEIYESVVKTAQFAVNKLPSDINISCGEIELYNDVIFTFRVSDGATGIIDVIVNNQTESINVGESYTIKNIGRGNYHINAIYRGDNNYLESSDEFTFEVGKYSPSINVDVSNITYGNDAVITVTLNNNATGNVSVVIDDKSSTAKLNNGQAILTISNLNAGQNKIVNVSYSGDDNYKKATKSATFNIEKAILDFTIDSNDAKIGKPVTVEIALPAYSGGTVTLSGIKSEVKNVPLSGIVKVIYDDLESGTYTVSAEYNGDNYQTLSKSTSFTVSLWDEPQWANDDGDVRHTGKSPYDSTVNGDLKWSVDVANITGNLAIDSEGNIYVTTKERIYSFDNKGALRWSYLNDAAGLYFSGISIGRDVIISPKADDTLYFINQSTGERYGHANIYLGSSYFAPVVDSNANIYISGQGDANNPNLIIIPYKLWENGGNPIVISLGDAFPSASPTIVDDTFVVVPCNDAIRVVDISSKSVVYSKSGKINVSSVIGDGNMIYSILGDSIYAFNLFNGNSWTTKITGGAGNQLAIDNEYGIYAVNAEGTLYRYDFIDGSELKFTNLTVTSGILIDNENNVYFASNNIFYALDCDGNILWKSKLDSNIVGKPIMDKNGIIYINSGNKVYALGQSSLKNPDLAINTENIYAGQRETITITLNEDATGLVEITINGNKSQEKVIGGKIIKTLDNLTSGDYDVDVKYLGDLRFESSTKSSHFTVLKYDSNMKVTVKNINGTECSEFNAGDIVVFYIELNPDATGIVSLNVDGITNSSYLIGGTAKIAVDGLTTGIKLATIKYIGDEKYLSGNASCNITVNALNSKFNIKNGVQYSVYAVDYAAGERGKILKFKLLDSNNNPVSGERVKLSYGKNVIYKTTDGQGIVSFVINAQVAGTYKSSLYFAGDEKYNSASASFSIKVNKKPITITAKAKTFKVKVKTKKYVVTLKTKKCSSNNGKIYLKSGKKVTLKVNGKTYTAKINAKGKATFKITKLTKKGKFIAYIKFAGDKTYKAATKKVKITVK